MKLANCAKIRIAYVGLMAAMVFGDVSVKAEIIMSEPTNVGPVINDAYDVQECDFSHDGLELYFSANRPGQYGKRDIYVARRDTLTSPWQEPINLGPNVNSPRSEVEPSISGDGLELYFGCWDDWNLRVCTRSSKDTPWSSPVKVGPPVGSDEPAMEVGSNDVWGPDISADGLSLYFNSTRVGGYGDTDIWVAKRATIDDEWGEPVNLGPNVNSASGDMEPCIPTDGLTLVFNRGLRNMMASTRKSIDDDWGPAVDLGFPAPGNFYGPAISPDGSTIYFDAAAPWGGYGDNDIWQVKFIPVVDFNVDGIVDSLDMCIMGENWHTNSTLCDIAPLPLGDGFVDVQDMVILSECLFPGLAAHWKLDEQSGDTAHSSTGENDGTLNGNPTWQPGEGKYAGALEFDGTDDYISTPFIMDPSKGSFSVFAWVYGGASGKVILSQADTPIDTPVGPSTNPGSMWLGIDYSEGKLMTGLGDLYFGTLVSESLITNLQWHHVGFVYDTDTFHRKLYVDGALVAEDATVVVGDPSDGGLYIGASNDLDAEAFFSGLIDDVRIYKQILSPEEIAALAQ